LNKGDHLLPGMSPVTEMFWTERAFKIQHELVQAKVKKKQTNMNEINQFN